jgi:hypothetical protein
MVHEKAIPEVVDRVYRFLARRYHPDVHPPEQRQTAERKMLELNLAYQVLSDPAKRAEYDTQRRLGGPMAEIDDLGVAQSLLKCFNHPQRPSVAFCSECGRPICMACVAPIEAQHELRAVFGSGRTVCETCVRRSTDLEIRIRAGQRAEPEGAVYRRPMGWAGVAVYYVVLALIFAAVCALVFWVATVTGATVRQAVTIAAVVAVLYVLLITIRLAWRWTCPNCRAACGRVDFRRVAPWRDFFGPHPVCPECGRHFLKQEVDESFD